MSNWRVAIMPLIASDRFSITMEEREFYAGILHESFTDELVALDYTDVKINQTPTGLNFFEDCNFKNGCSKNSYWPPIFRDTLLLPTLEYLRESKQIKSFALLPHGNITIERN